MSKDQSPSLDEIKKWRKLTVQDTIRIAHYACRGVSFTGCSKMDVIRSVCRRDNYYTVDLGLFVRMMNAASSHVPVMRARHKDEINDYVKDLFEESKDTKKQP